MVTEESGLRRQYYYLSLLLWVLPSLSSAADDPLANVETLTVGFLVEQVLERNPGHAELDAAVSEARSRILPAGSLDDPQLSYSLAPQTFAGNTADRFRQTIELSQSIPWPGTLALREQQAASRAEMAHYHQEDHELEVIMAIKVAFAEYYYVHHALKVNQDNRALLLELRDVAEGRYASGRSTQQDVLQAEIRHALLEDQAIGLERNRLSLTAQINALLNRSPRSVLPPPAMTATLVEPADSETLHSIAVQHHPQLLRLEAGIEAGRAAVGLAEKRFYPDIRLQAGYSNMWENTDMRFTLGAAINLPFDRDRRRADRDAAEAGINQIRWQLVDQRNLLLARLEDSRARVIESLRLIELYEQRLLPLARENLTVTIADYQTGATLFSDVIDAEVNELETDLKLLRSRAEYLRRYAELERWTGQPTALRHAEIRP